MKHVCKSFINITYTFPCGYLTHDGLKYRGNMENFHYLQK